MQLPKLGLVKCRISKAVKGRILSATISQNPSGKYFVSICCTDVGIKPMPPTGAAVGIDVGVNVNNQRAVRFRVWANQIVEE